MRCQKDYSVHCDHCQSWPDGYYCSCSELFYHDEKGERRARECFFEYYYDDEWIVHPCIFFTGEVRIHEDEEGNSLRGKYYARRIKKPGGHFHKLELVESTN